MIEALKTKFPDHIEEVLLPDAHPVDIPTLFLEKTGALEVLRELKEVHGLSFLTDYTASDEGGEKRFHLILHLMGVATKVRLRIKIRIAESELFPSLIPLWEGANWAEREIFDMFGIRFEGHPDLRRILMDVRWEGHPLRKDYPLRGYQVFLSPEPIDPELFK
ncbi:MAG: NADH-quinone oxidoreductase subunit C [Bdellovibrionales bacterium]|nr:NADH-quinone oxidoreductase subunit C [Bdellovibrionales bacterium]